MYWLPSIVLQLKMLKLGQESFSLWLWVMIQSCSSLIFESDIIFSFSQKNILAVRLLGRKKIIYLIFGVELCHFCVISIVTPPTCYISDCDRLVVSVISRNLTGVLLICSYEDHSIVVENS